MLFLPVADLSATGGVLPLAKGRHAVSAQGSDRRECLHSDVRRYAACGQALAAGRRRGRSRFRPSWNTSPIASATAPAPMTRARTCLLGRAWLCLPAARHSRQRRQRRPDRRRIHAAGAEGRLRSHRLDRRAEMVHRQRRHDRHLLGRLQRLADRGHAAAGAEDDHHRGLHRRPLGRPTSIGSAAVSPRTISTGRSTMLAHNDLPPDPEIVGEKWRAMWDARIRHNTPWILTLAEASAPRRLLEAGLGLRGFLQDQDPGLCGERLGRQLFGIDPASARRVVRSAQRADRPLGAFLSPLTRTVDAGDRLAAGSAALVGSMAEGQEHRHHGRAAIPGLDAGKPAAEDLLSGTPRPLGGRDRMAVPAHRVAQAVQLDAGGALEERTPPHHGAADLLAALGRHGGGGDRALRRCQAEWATDQREDDGGSLVFVTEPLQGASRDPRRAAARSRSLGQAASAGCRALERRCTGRQLDARHRGPAQSQSPQEP